jgi:hypothetical protein
MALLLLAAAAVNAAPPSKPSDKPSDQSQSWSNQVTAAVRGYQKQVSAALQPLFADLDKLKGQAAAAPANPPGSLVPPSPVEPLGSYRDLFVLAALPDKWQVDLLNRALKARDQGLKAKGEGAEPEKPYAKFQAAFAGAPRGLSLPKIPGASEPETAELPLTQVLAALQKTIEAGGSPEAGGPFAEYQKQADRFCSLLAGKVNFRVRSHLLALKGTLAKLLPENPPEWDSLPDDVRQPAFYFLASHYFQGHGGQTGLMSATGTGSGDTASSPTDSGTGSAEAKEPGPTGTGSGDDEVEPTEAGTGRGTETPAALKDRPGTGAGKVSGPPSAKGTGK